MYGSQLSNLWHSLLEQLGIKNEFVHKHGLLSLAILLGIILILWILL